MYFINCDLILLNERLLYQHRIHSSKTNEAFIKADHKLRPQRNAHKV